MSSSKDIEISSLSYVDKDFGTIYPEVLRLAKQLTNKWDPSQSNESDPGVVLLKEAAFVADHNNYNIDKNILENFLPTATQERSVRNIVEMNGYVPQYYVSATGEVTFKWENPDAEQETYSNFSIPAFTLVISNEDETVSYTQISDISISLDTKDPTKPSLTSIGTFIEGTLQTLIVNNSSTVLLENLDDNNRIYLPETTVAQNGIYIKYANENAENNGYWVRNNYLLTQPSGSKVFKLDFDASKELPYIEFPSDIANIIGDGIVIKYISTSGSSGNVSANTLKNIITPSEFVDSNGETRSCEYLTLSNYGSILNGKDPETIDQMYKSFKKIVGTFDTLVSCNDYANAIYQFDNIVSNVYVTDRRTDYNKAANVVSYDINGPYFKNISIKPCKLTFNGIVEELPDSGKGYEKGDLVCVEGNSETSSTLYVYLGGGEWESANTINLNDFSLLTEAMTPYDLVIYALKIFSMNDYNENTPYTALESSFKPISDNDRRDIEGRSRTTGYLDEYKCICHTFNDPANDDIYLFKNYAPLTVILTPYNKVASEDKESIYQNVYKALSQNFNPRELDFGVALNKEKVKSVIINSDSRIKDCDVDYSYNLRAMQASGNEVYSEDKDFTYTTVLIDLIAKNILAGRVCLFNFDEEFKYDYCQSDSYIAKNISKISTEVPIYLEENNNQTFETLNVDSNTDIIKVQDGDVEYLLHAPNNTNKHIPFETRISLEYNDDYTVVDEFKIKKKNESGEVIEELEYRSVKGVVEYSLGFEADDPTIQDNYLVNSETSVNDYITLPDGELTIIETKVVTKTNGFVNLDYDLKKNEYIQIIYPNYYSDNTYGMYVNYRYESLLGTTIKANTDYTLQAGDYITLIYTVDGEQKQSNINPGDVVRTSFDLYPFTNETKGTKREYEKDGLRISKAFKSLTSNQTISTRVLLQTVLNSQSLQCYWIVNNKENALFTSESKETILKPNEYFIYTNSSRTEMIILGAGTKLQRTDDNDNQWIIKEQYSMAIESITENGLETTIPWQTIDFSENNFFITEMNVITLSEGDNLKITDETITIDNRVIDNKWKYFNGNIIYTSNNEQIVLPKVSNFYSIRSRLDIVSSPEIKQELFDSGSFDSENIQGEQTIELGDGTIIKSHSIKRSESSEITIDNNFKFYSSSNLGLVGDKDLELISPINMFFFDDMKEKIIEKVLIDGEEITINENIRNVIVDHYDSSSEGYDLEKFTYTIPFYYENENNWNRTYLIPICINGDNIKINARIYRINDEEEIDIDFVDYNTSESSKELLLNGDSMYFLSPTIVYTGELYVELSWEITKDDKFSEIETILLDDIKVIKGLNDELVAALGDIKNKLLERLNNIIINSDKPSTKFYYAYEPDSSISIDLERYSHYNKDIGKYDVGAFDNPDIMWDVNNVANKMTLPQIDLRNSNIKIDHSMEY